MKKTAIILALIILCLISLSGCWTEKERRSGTQLENALVLLERGKSTDKDVADSFGSPQKEIMGGEKGRIWVYQGNVNYGMFKGGHNALLALWFNNDGILTEYIYNKFERPDNTVKYATLLLGYGQIRQEEEE